MDPRRWERLKELFAAATDLPAAERPAFAARACGEDAGLRDELLSLLGAAAAPAAALLDAAAIESFGADLPDLAAGARAGEMAGPFRLVRLIGEGGMGEVYLGEREGDFRQRVAVKLVRPGFDGGTLLRRFLNERQTLANLDHPHIAKLIDGGTLASGSPWLALEYIEGVPLTAWCEEHDASLARRIELFLQVCGAVDYAHRRLVVHRDLKPANVLVTAAGVPKLLDFGIAKLLDPADLPPGGELTVAPLRAMTPDYASPEQVRGESVTTASDVYSLGVMLYRLLTGGLPYSFPTLSMRDLERVVCEVAPPPPSAAAPLGRWASDLDAIVLTALRKEAERRYPSAAALADDLRRCLAGLPVSARPDSWRYRTGKFARRHRAGLAAGGLLLAALVAGGVGVLWQAGLARGQALTTSRVSQAMLQLFEEGDPWAATPGDTAVREILRRNGARALEGLDDEPAVQAELLATLGEVFTRLEANEDAEELLRRARALPLAEATRAEVLHWLGIVVRRQAAGAGEAARAAGLAEAEAIHREELALNERRHGADSREVVHSLNALGTVLAQGGAERWPAAREVWTETLAIRRRLFGAGSAEAAESMGNLAVLAFQEGAYGEALSLLEESVAAYRAAYPDGHPDLATALNNLGMAHYGQGDAAAARAPLEEALALRQRLLGADHPHVAISLNNLGTVRYEEGDYAGAVANFERALAIALPRLGPEHAEVAQYRANLAAAEAAAADGGG